MKRFFSFVFAIWAGLSVYAQELTVKSLVEDTKDLAARTAVRYDLSDEPCALIKVYMAVGDATFSGNVVYSEMKAASEYWVYVSHGTKHLQINTAGYLPIDVVFADYGIAAVTKQITYKLIINVPELTNKPKVVTEQYVEFTVEPKNAMVEFDGKVVPLDKYGTASIYQHFGTYSYRVTANLYHAQQGEVVVKDPNNAHRVSVQLQPAFGFIKVPDTGTWKGATVYIDNEMKGTTPFTSDKLPSGKYNVRVVRPMYSSEEQSLVVEDGKTAVFSRALQPQFVTLTLSVKDKTAEIWVNGKKYNTGTWRGDLGFGSYKVECKKTNHRTAETTLNVTQDMATTIDLPVPTPITGALDITSTPSNAEIYLDGKKVGATPMNLPDVIIGDHTVVIKKENYKTSEEQVVLTEGKTYTISKELKEMPKLCSIDIIGSPKGASVYIDKVFRGLLPIKVENLERGKTYEVRIEERDYGMKRQKITINKDTVMSFDLSNVQGTPTRKGSSFVLIRSNPTLASIYVDGVNVGLTPKSVELGTGKHIIRVKKYGYKDSERTINSTTDTEDVSFDLERDYSVPLQEDIPSKSGTTTNKHQRNKSVLYNKTVKRSCSWDYQSYYDAHGEWTLNYIKFGFSAGFYPSADWAISGSVSSSFLGWRYKFFGMDLLCFRLLCIGDTGIGIGEIEEILGCWDPKICLNFPVSKDVTFLLNVGPSLWLEEEALGFTTSLGVRYSLRWLEGDLVLGYDGSLFLGVSLSIQHVLNKQRARGSWIQGSSIKK